VDRNDVNELLARASDLRDRLAGDRMRIEALTQAIEDEAWHARVPEAAPNPAEKREFARKAAALERAVNEELARLAARPWARAERTGT
jgi:hypothetical protein